MRALDLFAGARGWSVGARMAGITDDGVECMPEANVTARAAGFNVVGDDVWTFVPERVYNGHITSPPCQTFSQSGSGSGRKALSDVLSLVDAVEVLSLADLRREGQALGDERTALVLTPLWYALHAAPTDWLAWEQVPPVLPVWEACARVLREHGWYVWTGYLHSEEYGVAQTRKRAFLIASRHHQPQRPGATHSHYYPRTPAKTDPGVLPSVTMAEALGWTELTEVVSNYGTVGDPAARGRRSGDQSAAAAVTSKVDRNVVLRMTTMANSARRSADQPASTIAFGNDAASAKWLHLPDGSDRFAQQSDNEPDWGWPAARPSTVVAGRDLVQAPGATANRHNGSTKSRNDGVRLTVAEAGVLQSFPADYPWQGTLSRQYLQVGNAVPPLMAYRVLMEAAHGIL